MNVLILLEKIDLKQQGNDVQQTQFCSFFFLLGSDKGHITDESLYNKVVIKNWYFVDSF